jgi:hypothetical protein
MLVKLAKYLKEKVSIESRSFPQEDAYRFHLFVAILGTTSTTRWYVSVYFCRQGSKMSLRFGKTFFNLQSGFTLAWKYD